MIILYYEAKCLCVCLFVCAFSSSRDLLTNRLTRPREIHLGSIEVLLFSQSTKQIFNFLRFVISEFWAF